MNKYCERCYLRDSKPCMECSTCNPGHENFRPAPHMPTNADLIRAMSDEELAEFAVLHTKFFCTKKYGEVCEKPMSCTKCAKDWLKQPTEEE